jgi:hypothetical protein
VPTPRWFTYLRQRPALLVSAGGITLLLMLVLVIALVLNPSTINLASNPTQPTPDTAATTPEPDRAETTASPPPTATDATSTINRRTPLIKGIADRLPDAEPGESPAQLSAKRRAYLQEVKAAGSTHFRLDLEWRFIEKSPGRYDYADYDPGFADIRAVGLEPVPIYDYAPGWAAGKSEQACWDRLCAPLPGYEHFFSRFTKASTEHFYGTDSPTTPVSEIWNEPNHEEFWPNVDPALYLKYFAAGKDGIRRAYPEAIVITGGLTVGGGMLPIEFLSQLYDAGFDRYIDSNVKIGFHPYTDGTLPENDHADDGWGQMLLARQLVERRGDTVPNFWITELAWSTNDVSPADLSKLAANAFQLLSTPEYSWVEAAFWYSYRDNEKAMGLIGPDNREKGDPSGPSVLDIFKAA